MGDFYICGPNYKSGEWHGTGVFEVVSDKQYRYHGLWPRRSTATFPFPRSLDVMIRRGEWKPLHPEIISLPSGV